MNLAIESEDLVKIYGKAETGVRALDGAIIEVPRGSIFGLFGPNGSGKTTLISILIGLILPTSGSAKVFGHDVLRESVSIREKVSLLPEGFGLYDHMTALENLKFLGSLDGILPDRIGQRALEVLEIVGLKDRADVKASSFSRGMKQRLGIAQALLKEPELLLLDEPTAGIDPDGIVEFRSLIQKINKEGKTVFLSTHLLRDVGMICTHAAMIRKGKILVQGSMGELSRQLMGAEGYRYDIRVSAGRLDELLKEVRSLPEVKEASIIGDKLIVAGRIDIGEALFALISKGHYSVESLSRYEPTWDDLYQFYQKEG